MKIEIKTKKRLSKKGSGTLVVIVSALLFIIYTSSTTADVRHLKYMQEQYEKSIKDMYNVNVNIVESNYDEIV